MSVLLVEETGVPGGSLSKFEDDIPKSCLFNVYAWDHARVFIIIYVNVGLYVRQTCVCL